MATLINIGNNIKVNPKFISYFEGLEIVLANKHRYTVTADVIELVKAYVENRNTGAFHYKGKVSSVSNLPSTGNIDGDMYLVTGEDKYYAWNGTSWDDTPTIVNISTLETAIAAEATRATGKEQELDAKINAKTSDITISQLSESLKQYIEASGGGTITNMPDEEDLTVSDNSLKIKDRPATYGKGYKILRRGASFASQVTDANTIYEIRYDFDLGGASVTLPANVELKFEGGRILNGTFASSYYSQTPVRPEYFGAVGDGVEDDTKAIKCAFRCTGTVALTATYYYTASACYANLITGGGTLMYGTMTTEHDWMTIDGIKFSGTYESAIMNWTKNIRVWNCTFNGCCTWIEEAGEAERNSKQGCILNASSGDCYVDNCEFTGTINGQGCIMVWSANTTTKVHVTNCLFKDNNYRGISGGKGIIKNCTFLNHGCERGTANLKGQAGNAIYTGRYEETTYISDCIIDGCTENAIEGASLDISNCTIRRVGLNNDYANGWTKSVWAVWISGGCNIHNCEISDTGRAAISFRGTTGTPVPGKEYICQIENCNIKNCNLRTQSITNFETEYCAIGIDAYATKVIMSNNDLNGYRVEYVGTDTSEKHINGYIGHLKLDIGNKYMQNDIAMYDTPSLKGSINFLTDDVVYKTHNANISTETDAEVGDVLKVTKSGTQYQHRYFVRLPFRVDGGALIVAKLKNCKGTFDVQAVTNFGTSFVNSNVTRISNADFADFDDFKSLVVTATAQDDIILRFLGVAGGDPYYLQSVEYSVYSYRDSTVTPIIMQTKARPILTEKDKGFQFYDTTLGKPIWWNGTDWVDATGTAV